MSISPAGSEHPAPYGHEPESASVSGTVAAIISLAILIALIMTVVYWFMGEVRQHRMVPPEYTRPRTQVQQPSLSVQDWTDPGQALEQLRQREYTRLHNYEWIDRAAGRVQIPITRAMELLAGGAKLPSAPSTAPAGGPAAPPATEPATAPAATGPSEGSGGASQ